MFSADLSWTGPDLEKVGERRDRIARERQNERWHSPVAPSINSGKTSRSSVHDDRETWWPSSLRKARNKKPAQPINKPWPDTSHTKKATKHFPDALPQPCEMSSLSISKALEIGTSDSVRDPAKQPPCIYSGTLSQPLPSGAPLDAPGRYIPELEGDLSSQRSVSTGSRSSRKLQHAKQASALLSANTGERRWRWRAPGKIKVMNEVHEIQQLSPQSYVSRTTRLSSEEADPQSRGPTPIPDERKERQEPYTVSIEGCLDIDALRLDERGPQQQESEDLALLAAKQRPSYASSLVNTDLVAWRPPSDWNIVLPNSPIDDEEKKLPSAPTQEEATSSRGNSVDLTRFQRFIRRMESAGPKIILDRLKEEWTNPVDDEMCEEMTLEKQLWVLTAFQLENLGRYSRFPKSDTGKILELYGSLSEVYQLSAMYPGKEVHYLTTNPPKATPLPENVSPLLVSKAGTLPFPYADGSFSHIRASTLPSLVPSAILPAIFRECYRLLAPGGMLEIRIMDAAPMRWTAGPKMKAWIEDRVSMNLERLFRCSKPCTLVPGWVADAGFKLPTSHTSGGDENVKLRCAFNPNSSAVDAELSALVGRALWKDIWGDFVDQIPDEPQWWWEDDEVVKECLERETVFECGSIFAFKD